VKPSTVARIRLKHGRWRRYHQERIAEVEPGYLTIPQLAKRLGVSKMRLYRQLRAGALSADTDSRTGYLIVPDDPGVIEQLENALTTTTPTRSA
jgi:excisionase family DNA binding protein